MDPNNNPSKRVRFSEDSEDSDMDVEEMGEVGEEEVSDDTLGSDDDAGSSAGDESSSDSDDDNVEALKQDARPKLLVGLAAGMGASDTGSSRNFLPSSVWFGNGDGSGDAPTPPDDGKLMFAHCGGLQKQIQFIRNAVLDPLLANNAEQYKRFGLIPPKGILFHGPPGTGKTRLAMALQNELAAVLGNPVNFMYHKGNDTASKYFGQSSANLRNVFREAKQKKPTILFFDELDGLCPSRENTHTAEAYTTTVTTMLGLMDEVVQGEVFVIGATNRLLDIDPALRRPGRFDKYLEFSVPGESDRLDILTIHTNKWKARPDRQLLAKMSKETAGFSGADLAKLCSDAFDNSLKRYMEETEGSLLNKVFNLDLMRNFDSHNVKKTDWEAALSQMTPSTKGVFGSTQFFWTQKDSDFDFLEPLLRPRTEVLVGNLLSLVEEQQKSDAEKDRYGSLYVWTDPPNTARDMDRCLLQPVFGLYAGEKISNMPKYLLSAFSLNLKSPRQWPSVIEKTFSQAAGGSEPTILYIPQVEELLKQIHEQGLSEAIDLNRQLDNLRGSHVIVVMTGETSPEKLRDAPIGFNLRLDAKQVKIEPGLDTKTFFSRITPTGILEPDVWFMSQDQQFKTKYEFEIGRAAQILKNADIGPIVNLFTAIRHALLLIGQEEPDHAAANFLRSIRDMIDHQERLKRIAHATPGSPNDLDMYN